MKTSLKELLFALVAFTLSYSVAHITEIEIVKDAVLLAFLIQWVLFVPAYIFQTEKFYDLSGSLTYISVVSFCFYNNYESNNINLGNLIISLTIIIWAIRLGSFLFIRIKKAGEDIRFREIKKSPSRFFMTWTLQGMWVSLCSACALAGIANGIVINAYFYIGIVIFMIGFTTEIIADNQKSIFRKDPYNKDKFISSGLWKYSRHPNYLGELLFWFGICLIGINSDAAPILIILCPIPMMMLFVFVSCPLMDERSLKNRSDYQEYMEKTSQLLLLPPKE